MTQTNSDSLACFRGVARSFRYFQFRGERGEDAGIVSNAKQEPSKRFSNAMQEPSKSQARDSVPPSKNQAGAKQNSPLPREEGARYGNCQELRAKKVRELTRATSHYISTSARATSQARRPLPREEGAITFISSSNFSRKPKCGGG